MKTCVKCLVSKSINDFYEHKNMKDGRLNKCKECVKSAAQRHRLENKEYYSEYEKIRYSLPERKAAQVKYREAYKERSLGKIRARKSVSTALMNGKLIKLPCEKCGNKKVEAHHDDYRKPLVVRWLCRKHHLEHHGKVAY